MSVAYLGVVSTVQSVKSSLGASLQAKQAGHVLGSSIAEALMGPAILKMAKVLQTFPSLKTGIDPASLIEAVDQADAMQSAEDAVSDLLGRIQYSRKALLGQTWKDMRTAYNAATRAASSDGSLGDALAPLAALFVKTKRTLSAAAQAATETVKSVAAGVRAATSASNAATARQRASELVPQLTITGTGDATITQPAPSAPAPSTTSPAPGGTPGTPGSTTIR